MEPGPPSGGVTSALGNCTGRELGEKELPGRNFSEGGANGTPEAQGSPSTHSELGFPLLLPSHLL